ncbi:hypothetical protein FOZ63_004623, partial [Perkinsus olseni]
MVGPLKPHRAERAPPVALMKGASNSETFFARLHHWHATVWPGANIPVVLAIVILALALWWLAPSGLASNVWQLFVLFMCTIIGAILEPLPLSAVCLISIGVVSATGVLTTSEMLSGFSSPSVWLIMFASFFASGFVVTGLGKRMCFIILKYAGSTTVGLGYGICFCELILALAIPANSARGVGVMMPILLPLMKEAFQSDPELDTAKRIGSYIVLVEITANATVAAGWLTGGAWNALNAYEGGVLGLWILSSTMPSVFPFSMTGVAAMGVAVLLLLGVLSLKDHIICNTAAFDLFLWFSILLTFATELKKKGFFEWLAARIDFSSLPPYPCLVLVCVVFYVTQYGFASITAHVSALFVAAVLVAEEAGVSAQ